MDMETPSTEVRICVGQHCHIGEFKASTIDGAMQKVRERKEQSK
jgi:hypothetical protein